jgi:hypothetical protein
MFGQPVPHQGVATISNPTPNYCGTIFLLELLLEVKFSENVKLLRAVCGFGKSEAEVGIGAVVFKALPRFGGQRMCNCVS